MNYIPRTLYWMPDWALSVISTGDPYDPFVHDAKMEVIRRRARARGDLDCDEVVNLGDYLGQIETTEEVQGVALNISNLEEEIAEMESELREMQREVRRLRERQRKRDTRVFDAPPARNPYRGDRTIPLFSIQ